MTGDASGSSRHEYDVGDFSLWFELENDPGVGNTEVTVQLGTFVAVFLLGYIYGRFKRQN